MKLNNKEKINKKKALYQDLFIAVIISFILLVSLVGIREYRSIKRYREATNVYNMFMNINGSDGISLTDEKMNVDKLKIGSYKVIGTIKIESINLEYPILDRTNPESLDLSITKLNGPNLNEIGNVAIAGHNAFNGTLFSRLSSVRIGDVIEITDEQKRTLRYEVYDIYRVYPNDIAPLKTRYENKREITLISCTMDAKKRVIVKALEIEDED